MVVGAIGDDDGGTDRGTVWVLFLDSDATDEANTTSPQISEFDF